MVYAVHVSTPIPFIRLEKINDKIHLVNQVKVKQIVLGQIDLRVNHPDFELTSLVVFFIFVSCEDKWGLHQ